ncbi:ATP synthase subunit I [Comamonas serinivorans]|nr:ATP synthase subunit I [Comamonas serinivorans]
MLPLLWQLALGGLVVLVAWVWFSDRPAVAMSALYGACAVWVPGWVFVRALKRQQQRAAHAMAALSALMLWEGIKIVLTIALLLAAPRVVKDLSWLALLIAFVVTVKAAWLGWWWQMRPSKSAKDY